MNNSVRNRDGPGYKVIILPPEEVASISIIEGEADYVPAERKGPLSEKPTLYRGLQHQQTTG